MKSQAIEDAVDLLIAARGDHRRLDRLPDACAPATVEDGYAVQNALADRWGLEVAGWKIGCTSKHAQEMLGTESPFPGRVFAPFLLESPAEISASSLHQCAVESEFAFKLSADLPARATPYSRAEVEAAVATVHPAIELINNYWTDWLAAGVAHIIADNGSNGGLVLGPGTANWQELDLAAQEVVLTIDGKTIEEGTGAIVLGHPLEALTWLTNDLSKRGIGLSAGQAVTTGTCTGLHFTEPVSTAIADFGDLGTAQVTFTE